MNAICRVCQKPFDITEDDLQFYQKVSPVITGIRYDIPPPVWCPDCRQMRRLTFRNERTLYERSCDVCHKNIVSSYPSDVPFPVYCTTCYWSDRWDGKEYGMDFDFHKTFAENFSILQQRTPRIASMVLQSCHNSDYTNWSDELKHCYLIYASSRCEDCYYSSLLVNCKNCMDCQNCTGCQLCFECISSNDCYHGLFLQYCANVNDSAFCFGCQGCDHCLFCSNLRKASYCISNKPVSKEQFERIWRQTLEYWTPLKKAREMFHEQKQHVFRKAANIVQCEQSTGNNLIGCKNALSCFDSTNLEDCKFVTYGVNLKDCYDLYAVVDNTQLSYEIMSVNGGYHVLFCTACWDGCNDLIYCDLLKSATSCFGCIALKRDSYCILNKQYTINTYRAHQRNQAHILDQMSVCPFPVNLF